MRYPEREPDVLQLARQMAQGLADHPDWYPAPPVAPEEIQEVVAEYQAARFARQQAWADRRERRRRGGGK